MDGGGGGSNFDSFGSSFDSLSNTVTGFDLSALFSPSTLDFLGLRSESPLINFKFRSRKSESLFHSGDFGGDVRRRLVSNSCAEEVMCAVENVGGDTKIIMDK